MGRMQLLTTAEVTEYLGIKPQSFGRHLKPVRKSSGQNLYSLSDVKKYKAEQEKKRAEEAERTLYPEDLSDEKRRELQQKAVEYEAWKKVGEAIGNKGLSSREFIENMMGQKEHYTGDAIISSISYGYETEITPNEKEMLGLFDPGYLSESGIAQTTYDVERLVKKGPLIVKERIQRIIKNFNEFMQEKRISYGSKKFQKGIEYFMREYGLPDYIKPVLVFYAKGTLSEKKLGNYSRNIAERFVKRKPKKRKLIVTLTKPVKDRIYKIAADTGAEFESPKLKELEKELFEEKK